MKRKLLVILGPTSTGKTDLALYLAKKFNGELVSADSRQVYKYLDLGTGKLPGEFETVDKKENYWEIDGIKIWLYDVVEPKIRFNLYEYITKSQEIIQKIIESGKLPILIGGTGLYIRSLLEGLSNFGTSEDGDLRSELEELDTEKIKERISQINPEIIKSLNNSELNNKRRLIRIVEKLASESQKPQSPFLGIEKDFDVLRIGLSANRDVLSDRIKKRVINRIKQGMIDEARDLIKFGKLDFKRMDELGLEYRYLAKFLNGEIKTEQEFIDILSLKIRQFAKRQQTWFKKEKEVIWFDTEKTNFMVKVEMQLLDWYNNHT